MSIEKYIYNMIIDKKEKHNNTQILDWIKLRNEKLSVSLKKVPISECTNWFYDCDEGCIRNESKSFFSIYGIEQYKNSKLVKAQPIIIQNEIGYLGIIMKMINGIPHFLMQAKIEPGNINKVQISPTLQATKSNFTQMHGGRKPKFIEYFETAKPENILVDQIQSEQSSRFLGKRNRNVIIVTDDEIEEGDNFRWMTLRQIKYFMRYNNLVNMDTRTVVSCIPFAMFSREIIGLKKASESPRLSEYVEIFNYINNYKMYNEIQRKLIPLKDLKDWRFNDKGEFVCKYQYPFKVIFCDISIEGREVQHWRQPCFEAEGIATFALIYKKVNGVYRFLVNAKPEIGCFDNIELAPSIQIEYGAKPDKNIVVDLFYERYKSRSGVNKDVLLSEEGGRFYHEQNRNILLEINENELNELPGGYFWCTFTTLNMLCQVNNVLNIQLRNLLSLLEWGDVLC